MRSAATLTIIFFAGVILFMKAGEASAGEAASDLNIHYTGQYCSECHEETPVPGGNKYLKNDGDMNWLCKCHGYNSATYIHPVDVVPSEEKRAKVPEEFTLVDGKISCQTCHDMYLQCRKNDETKTLNKFFLRGAPYQSRTALCFRCHDEKKYARLDPHGQLDPHGSIIPETCLYCHTEKPDEKSATFEDVGLIGDLRVICERCHSRTGVHPVGANHLRIPSITIASNMKAMEVKFGAVFPLDNEGKVTCITCHNPHEKGVIPVDKKGAKGAGESSRQRLPKIMCKECHGMT